MYAFLIPIVFFSIIALIVKWGLDHSKWKIQHQSGIASTDNSLGTSELKDMMRQAVIEANTPLAERIAALEAELRQAKAPRLRPAQHDPMLEELRQTREEVPEPAERRGVT